MKEMSSSLISEAITYLISPPHQPRSGPINRKIDDFSTNDNSRVNADYFASTYRPLKKLVLEVIDVGVPSTTPYTRWFGVSVTSVLEWFHHDDGIDMATSEAMETHGKKILKQGV